VNLLRASCEACNCLTRAPVDLALALFGLSLLFVRLRSLARASARQADTRRVLLVCACTHYLVFKEPDRRCRLRDLGLLPHQTAQLAVFVCTILGNMIPLTISHRSHLL